MQCKIKLWQNYVSEAVQCNGSAVFVKKQIKKKKTVIQNGA